MEQASPKATGTALDAETILATTEEVLRRHGPGKATVVDVARALGVSHAAVYRHFPSKAALREAVVRRWAARAHDSLAAVADDTSLAPPERLRAWLHALFQAKRAKALGDPELFATYGVLVAEHSQVIEELRTGQFQQLRGIIADGVATGVFAALPPHADLDETTRAVFEATALFQHPAHKAVWNEEGIGHRLDAVCTLVLNGLAAQPH